MANKVNKPKKKRGWRKNNAKRLNEEKKTRQPNKLSVLCERVIRKYKLPFKTEERKEVPTSYTIVGGKPLRKRKDPSPASAVLLDKKNPKKNKSSSTRGRPRKAVSKQDSKTLKKPKNINIPEIFVPTNPGPSCVRIKEEEPLDLPVDYNPLDEDDDDDFTVVIKEETEDQERKNLTVPFLVPSQNPVNPNDSTVAATTNLPVMTVVMDDIQIFANNIAEQLRLLPVNRALLLQLDIQSMLDNERQLLMDER